MTQLDHAKAGTITDAMQEVARAEKIAVKHLQENITQGKVIIPANTQHKALKPIGIGRILTTKINANIGNSPTSSGIHEELEKIDYCMRFGADTAMDLSTGKDLDAVREAILERSTIPIGTVPLYQAIADSPVEELTIAKILKVIEKQAQQGVDYMTIHCGLLKHMIPLTSRRVMGIVSRGGALIAKWMTFHKRENPLYESYEAILDILHEYDVTISLGDSLRPGCLADATDEAQIAELKVLGELTRRARARGVQAMVEGPGHIPLHQIKLNMDLQAEHCDGAPFYVLGPLVTDIAPGYDHITSSIGATFAAYHGASFLCYVTPKEHLGLPNKEDVRQGIIAYKIAAHAADIAKGVPGTIDRDTELSRARFNFDWQRQYALSLDPERAQSLREEGLKKDSRFCSMCGPRFCSINLSHQIEKACTHSEAAQTQNTSA